MSVYHACASANKCKGLGEGIRGYHACAKKQNCKKDDRAKVAAVVSKIKTSKAKATLAKVVKKKVEVIRKPKTMTDKEKKDLILHYSMLISESYLAFVYADNKEKSKKEYDDLGGRDAIWRLIRKLSITPKQILEMKELKEAIKKYVATEKEIEDHRKQFNAIFRKLRKEGNLNKHCETALKWYQTRVLYSSSKFKPSESNNQKLELKRIIDNMEELLIKCKNKEISAQEIEEAVTKKYWGHAPLPLKNLYAKINNKPEIKLGQDGFLPRPEKKYKARARQGSAARARQKSS